LFVADLSNIEARLLAHVARQDNLLQQYASGEDIYCNFASRIFNKPINKENNPLERFIGKTAILGLGYGMGAKKFMLTLPDEAKINLEQSIDIVQKYRNTHPNIPILWGRMQELLLQSLHRDNYGVNYGKFLTIGKNSFQLPNGMRLYYHKLQVDIKNNLEYTSGNRTEKTWGGRITENVIQALARLIMTDSVLRLSESLPIGRVALTAHDELVIVASDKDPEKTMEHILRDLCKPPSWAPDLPLAAEGGYDTAYGKLDGFTYSNGTFST
jgi:DNA polymerase